MLKASIEIDRDIAREAAEILGTSTLLDTINASMHEVVARRRRLGLLELLADESLFDFSVVDRAWGAPSVGGRGSQTQSG